MFKGGMSRKKAQNELSYDSHSKTNTILFLLIIGLLFGITSTTFLHVTGVIGDSVLLWGMGLWTIIISLSALKIYHVIHSNKQSHKALIESEERYRSLVELSPDAIVVHINEKIVYANSSSLKLFKAESAEDLIGKPILGFIHPDYHDVAKQRIHTLYKEKHSVDLLEEKFVRVDGQIIDVEVAAAPVMYQQQPAVQVIIREISERKKAEKALQEKEIRYRTLFEQSPYAVIIIDPDTLKPVEFNEQAAVQLGYTHAEFAKTTISDWEAGENIDEIRHHIQHIIQHGHDEFASRHRTKDGEIIDVFVNTKTIRVDNKTYFLSIIQDVTDKQEAMRSLSESEQRFRAIFESAKDSIFIKNKEFRYTHVNHAMELLFNCDASELIGKTDYELFGEEAGERIRQADIRVLSGELVEEEHTLPVNGVPFTFDAIKVPMYDDHGDIVGLCGIARDITHRKKSEEALQFRVEFEHLITSISSEFLRLKINDIDSGIKHTIEKIGLFTGAERTFITLFNEENKKLYISHFWQKDTEPPLQPEIRDSYCNALYTTWEKKLQAFEYVCITDSQKLADREKTVPAVFTEYHLQALTIVPLVYDDTFAGLISIEALKAMPGWGDDTVSLLQVVGEIIINAIKRKETQEKITELAAIPECNPHLIVTCTRNGDIKYMNPAVQEILQKSADNKQDNIDAIMPKEYRTVIERCLTTNRDVEDIRSCYNARTLRWDFHPVASHDIVHCYGYDITNQLQKEDELKMLSIALTQSANMIMITDTEGVIEYVNPQFCRKTGYSVAELLGKTPRILKSGKVDKAVYKNLWETIKAGRTWTGKIQNKRKNGELYWERKKISPIHNNEGKIINYISVGDDITVELQTQVKLAEADKLSAIGTLAAGVAHEFKNYLGGIIGNASFALEELEDSDNVDLARETLAQIVDIGEKANDVAMSLLSYSKAKSDDFTKQDLRKIINRAIRLVEKEMKNLSIEIVTHFDDVPPVEISASKIQQLLLNLLINAKHAIKSDGVVTIALLKEDDWIHIKVGDTGSGIPKENLNKIFDPFFSTKGVWGKDELVGTGMGLSICRNIAHEHGGELSVQSIVNMGTTFTLTLPIKRSSSVVFMNNTQNQKLRILFFTLNKSIMAEYFASSCKANIDILMFDNINSITGTLPSIANFVVCDAKFSGKVELYRMVEMCQKAKVPYILINCGTMEYQLNELYDNAIANFKELPEFDRLIQAFMTSRQPVVHT